MDKGSDNYRRFLAGSENGLVDIIKEYKDGLILYLNSFVNNINVAEELAEDTFVRIGIKKPKDNGGSSFKTWLYTIGRNIAIDYIRRNSKKKEVSIDECIALKSDEEDLEMLYIREERKIVIHRALYGLKTEYRQILWLIYFEGFSNKEAAHIMKKSVHSIETLVYRARMALKAELEKEGFIYEKW